VVAIHFIIIFIKDFLILSIPFIHIIITDIHLVNLLPLGIVIFHNFQRYTCLIIISLHARICYFWTFKCWTMEMIFDWIRLQFLFYLPMRCLLCVSSCSLIWILVILKKLLWDTQVIATSWFTHSIEAGQSRGWEYDAIHILLLYYFFTDAFNYNIRLRLAWNYCLRFCIHCSYCVLMLVFIRLNKVSNIFLNRVHLNYLFLILRDFFRLFNLYRIFISVWNFISF
jgi:hypothetical protein